MQRTNNCRELTTTTKITWHTPKNRSFMQISTKVLTVKPLMPAVLGKLPESVLEDTDSCYSINAQSTTKVISGWNRCHQKTSANLTDCWHHTSLYVWRRLVENEVEWTRKAEMRKAEFLAVGKARMAIYSNSLQTSKRRTINSSGFSAEENLIFASAVLHNGVTRWIFFLINSAQPKLLVKQNSAKPWGWEWGGRGQWQQRKVQKSLFFLSASFSFFFCPSKILVWQINAHLLKRAWWPCFYGNTAHIVEPHTWIHPNERALSLSLSL